MWNAGLDKVQTVIKTLGRNINNLRYADDTTLKAASEEELKSLLMKVKEESEKDGLKLNIQKTKIMASGPITSWQIDEEEMEIVTDFIFLDSKITADSDCSHGIKRCFLFERKATTNLDSVLKSRDITLLTKVHLVKVMVFPIIMQGYKSWVIKKAEHRTDAFELWCWRRLPRVPWTSRSNLSILKEINPDIHWKDWCWRWSSNTMATWWEEPTHWKRPWSWERLGAGGDGDEDEIVGWHHWLNGLEFEQTLADSEGQWSLIYCSPWGHKESATTDWTTTPLTQVNELSNVNSESHICRLYCLWSPHSLKFQMLRNHSLAFLLLGNILKEAYYVHVYHISCCKVFKYLKLNTDNALHTQVHSLDCWNSNKNDSPRINIDSHPPLLYPAPQEQKFRSKPWAKWSHKTHTWTHKL